MAGQDFHSRLEKNAGDPSVVNTRAAMLSRCFATVGANVGLRPMSHGSSCRVRVAL